MRLFVAVDLPDEARQAIFHDNIVRFYGPRVSRQPGKSASL